MSIGTCIFLFGLAVQSVAGQGVCNPKEANANAADAAFYKALDKSEAACRTNSSK